ncbi:(S)-2-haloacid dehalogenase IVA [Lophiotrema nucula]|uniref:(S)-2-haloacid dehalogenase IVA n=1 Tax=Lophiotrema nucula TaxID=690887 RepID=A0A6A5YPQ8_9PLEO|nr:(S)-2-haloacid dehalogenase IVA [Lophiotrema nucula]
MASSSASRPRIQAAFFDFMGTCLDWCSAVTAGLPSTIPETERRDFALQWRVSYFRENEARLKVGLPTEDIDQTLARTLDRMLESDEYASLASHFSPTAKEKVIASWHEQPAWPDVAPALQQLRDLGLEVFVHANGTTRLQLDLIRSSGLQFDLLMSSQMLGQIKPAPEPYLKGAGLVKRKPEEVVMVAAHVSDVRGARAVGMRAIYIKRSTDDIHEDLSQVDTEFDVALDGMDGLAEAVKIL